ncbi:hypothetical protein [Streptomyces roseolilacinus]|uniref:hypothetical protein n=1 Tax=Streptomyces roseolilacinus TaxID=66904 RepID=UPI003822EBBE
MTAYDNGQVPADRILTADEGTALKGQLLAPQDVKRWRWMGTYSDGTAAATVANANPPQGPGEAVFSANGGWISVWLYY